MRHSTTQTAARAILALRLALAGCGGPTAPAPGPASQVEADVAYLASPALGGRAAGSPGSADAALFLARRHTELGLQGAFPGRCTAIDLAANGQGFLGLLDSLATSEGILPLFTTSLSGRSDHGPCDEVMIPAFALFTGFHADYHTANDIPARVDVAGIVRIVDLVERLVRSTGSPVSDAR